MPHKDFILIRNVCALGGHNILGGLFYEKFD